MMLYPAMNKLTANVPNRYLLVNVVARRARQIAQEAEDAGRRWMRSLSPWPSKRWPMASTPSPRRISTLRT